MSGLSSSTWKRDQPGGGITGIGGNDVFWFAGGQPDDVPMPEGAVRNKVGKWHFRNYGGKTWKINQATGKRERGWETGRDVLNDPHKKCN
ncbi:MAG TPA: hypothetical protein VGX48_08555 [Pyrinomonadaceae bacterium]|jgi:hypothetical protein|nr:hypothetical protein [Pyrinomonadaceae bacterium]